MGRFNYYGLYGTNGIGVFTNWNICKRETEYVGDCSRYKGFSNYQEAYDWTTRNYLAVLWKYRHGTVVNIPKELPLNFFILTKNMRMKGMMDASTFCLRKLMEDNRPKLQELYTRIVN